MKKRVSVIFVVLLLVGCSSNKKTTTVCTGKDAIPGSDVESIEIEHTYEASGDEITKMIMIEKIDLKEFYSNEEIEGMKDDLGASEYQEIEGVEYVSNLNDGIFEVKITIEYSKVDMEELVDAGLVGTESGKTPKYVSLEKTIINTSYTCEEK